MDTVNHWYAYHEDSTNIFTIVFSLKYVNEALNGEKVKKWIQT